MDPGGPKCTLVVLPAGNLSHHVDAVLVWKATEVGDDGRCDHLIKCTRTTVSVLDLDRLLDQEVKCGCSAPCWGVEGTCHNELDGDGQGQLLTVAAVDFFDQNEHKESHDAN